MGPGGFNICRPAPIACRPGYEQGLTLMSDLHIGSSDVDYGLITRELKKAADAGDRVLINGDVFDLILTRDKKRYTPSCLHPRLHGRSDVINGAVEWAVELLSPVAHLVDMIGIGNHEQAVEKHHDLDVVKLLIGQLEYGLASRQRGHVIHYGGYGGYVDYHFYDAAAGRTGHDNRFVIHFYHGSGSGSPMSKGLPDFCKRHWVDADVIWMGHRHTRFNAGVRVVSCPPDGNDLVFKNVRYVMTGAYMDVYGSQPQADVRAKGRRGNYAADAGLAPQAKGGARVFLKFDNGGYDVSVLQ